MSVGDLWHGMASRKSHVRELKNWMPRHSKKPSVRVELIAGGDPHKSEKPEWSAGDMRPWPKKDPWASSFSQGSFIIFFDSFNVNKIAAKFFDLFKVSKIAARFFDMFKVSKITTNFLTCSKSSK